MTSTQDQQQIVQKSAKYESWRRRIFALTWLTYFGFYLTRKAFAASKSSIDLDMDETMMGWIDSAYLAAYAVGQFVWGATADKIGPRRVILIGLGLSIAACLAMGASSMAIAFLVINLIQGLAQSSGWAPLTKNLSSWYSRKERGTVLGWWTTNYAVGGLVATPLAAASMAWFGGNWRFAFYIPALCLFGIFLLIYFFQRNKPHDVGLPSIEEYHGEEKEAESEKISWLEIIKLPMIGLLGLSYFLLKPTRYAILLWGPYYVAKKLQTGVMFSTTISISFELAGILGSILAGILSDKVFKAKRMPFIVIALFLLSSVLFFFDGFVTRTTKQVNLNSAAEIATNLQGLSTQETLKNSTNDLLALIDSGKLDSNSLKLIAKKLSTVELAGIDERIQLKQAIVELRKISRSQLLASGNIADVYRSRLSEIVAEMKELNFTENHPAVINMQATLKLKKLESKNCVIMLDKTQTILVSGSQDSNDIQSSLLEIRNDILQYLEDRGDDISFAFQTELQKLAAQAQNDEQLKTIHEPLLVLHAAPSLVSDEIQDQLKQAQKQLTKLPQSQLNLKLSKLLQDIQFNILFKKSVPAEKMTSASWVMVICLFLIGFFLFGADSQISGVAAVDFGHQKGASSATGFINGCGSVSAIFGGIGVGYIAQNYNWSILFNVFATMTLIAA
ncbi:MAG: MFS transporter, partial [Lentisphaerales bacterium]|nr:MFS transporter [Lentisphaerales bacterium]